MSTSCLNHMGALSRGSLSKLDIPSGVLHASVVAPVFLTVNCWKREHIMQLLGALAGTGRERLIWRTGSGLELIFTDWRACLKSISLSVIKTNTKCSFKTKDRPNAWVVKWGRTDKAAILPGWFDWL